MSTIAEELLQDFEDSGSEAEESLLREKLDIDKEDGSHNTYPLNGANGVMDVDDDEDFNKDEEMTEAASLGLNVGDEYDMRANVEKMDLGNVDDVRRVARKMKKIEPVLERIAHFQSQPPDKQATTIGSIEENPEYHLLTTANTLSTEIDHEIMVVHKFIRDHYSIRFPELETLVTNPLDYAKVVTIIGNGPMDSDSIKSLQACKENRLGVSLRSVLDGPSVMIVTVEATTTKGREMTPDELERVNRACDMALALDRAKRNLTDYVRTRMNLFAPNLTALIGSLTAAQLLNFAGGLTGLAKTPACNLAPLGSKKQTQTGFATNVGIRQQGYLYHSPIIRGIPNDLKRQALRILSAKVVLAARVDRVHNSLDGSTGEELKANCLERLEKLTEPPPNKGARALSAPDDKPARKRGGRRARKAKEATAMTDLRKAQNRMAFGKEEKEVGYGTGEGTKGLGMIGQANDGRIRNLQIDQRTKAKLSAKNKGWGGTTQIGGSVSSLRGFGQVAGSGIDLRGKGLRASGVGSTMGSESGTASSLAFTPVTGLNLVDPKMQSEMNRKRKSEEDRWFKGGTFTQVSNGSMGPPPPPKRLDTGSRKMGPPPLP
ncbi:BgTH12-00130 [Blumeria graminis f. sp. triticale]|uniref:Bgt-1969 n=3 Tax=Blumeria graminis TaxID=34373 RepID=A0A381L255_BLUGR|nr:Splicing factor component of the U4-U6-U5 snRNP complex [Blumeria graminis f. sp. tritici 96224]CAD6504622.1 BgTH12-00130 [Blumeria graminis f. sp. triticale]VDB92653.1 Bgt-1969 [Blumeria graminis f. sp. tritici]